MTCRSLSRVLTELVSKMRDMRMDKTELGCLRAIILFNPGKRVPSPPSRAGSLGAFSSLETLELASYPLSTLSWEVSQLTKNNPHPLPHSPSDPVPYPSVPCFPCQASGEGQLDGAGKVYHVGHVSPFVLI